MIRAKRDKEGNLIIPINSTINVITKTQRENDKLIGFYYRKFNVILWNGEVILQREPINDKLTDTISIEDIKKIDEVFYIKNFCIDRIDLYQEMYFDELINDFQVE